MFMKTLFSLVDAYHPSTIKDFYDPVADIFQEPPLTGISYSFTDDGHYEEAYYRAIPNREFLVLHERQNILTIYSNAASMP